MTSQQATESTQRFEYATVTNGLTVTYTRYNGKRSEKEARPDVLEFSDTHDHTLVVHRYATRERFLVGEMDGSKEDSRWLSDEANGSWPQVVREWSTRIGIRKLQYKDKSLYFQLPIAHLVTGWTASRDTRPVWLPEALYTEWPEIAPSDPWQVVLAVEPDKPSATQWPGSEKDCKMQGKRAFVWHTTPVALRRHGRRPRAPPVTELRWDDSTARRCSGMAVFRFNHTLRQVEVKESGLHVMPNADRRLTESVLLEHVQQHKSEWPLVLLGDPPTPSDSNHTPLARLDDGFLPLIDQQWMRPGRGQQEQVLASIKHGAVSVACGTREAFFPSNLRMILQTREPELSVSDLGLRLLVFTETPQWTLRQAEPVGFRQQNNCLGMLTHSLLHPLVAEGPGRYSTVETRGAGASPDPQRYYWSNALVGSLRNQLLPSVWNHWIA